MSNDNPSISRLLEDGHVGIAWWNGLDQAQRRYWLDLAQSARPVDAYEAYVHADDEALRAQPKKRGNDNEPEPE